MSTASVQLQQFCRIVQGGRLGLSGGDFVKEGLPAYGAGGLNGYLPSYEFDEPAVILSSIGARCGKCFYVEGRWTSLANTQLIFPDPLRADPKFLWFQLNDERRWHRSGTGQPFIKPADVKTHEAFLPSLPEQRRIAAILDKADAMRAMRRTALNLLDKLTESIFLDMFGDPVANPKRWPVVRVGDYVAEFQGGRSMVAEADDTTFTRNRVLKVSAVTGMQFRPSESKPVPDSYSPPEMHFVRPGDLLFSRANTTELVGAAAFVHQTAPNLLLPDKLWRFVWRRPVQVEPLFVWMLFQSASMRYEIGRRATGTSSSMKNISQEKVLGIRSVLPPLDLQTAFVRRFASASVLRGNQTAALAAAHEMFSSLRYRGFRGQL